MKKINCLIISIILVFFLNKTYAQRQDWRKYVTQAKMNWPTYFEPSESPIFVHNEIEINASPEKVWAILISTKDWKNWYNGAGDVETINAEKLEAKTKFNWRSLKMNVASEVKQYEPNKRLAYTVKTKGVDTYHVWLIVPMATGCKIITQETQHGFKCKMGKIFKPKQIVEAHQRGVEGLKKLAESNKI
ncbi:hypothetical protein GCM10011514_49760 [Emticicia aquatilis]|uniref:SRPBCC domain-containing protein n=1 Tax=Emticicia aquatilis TaxID=1537369 RepID=A0A916Z857_9BACT|nr:SRPBCC family protein [Emticicia aquatilis]GGD79819.1 hypothetical protein GCM10011514_49760 [Emticicia aquatilis]